MTNRGFFQFKVPTSMLALVAVLLTTEPAAAFCVRNDTGVTIWVEATDDSATFDTEIPNNKKTCCSPKEAACGISKKTVQLSISSSDGGASCAITVGVKGNVNVTGNQEQMKCKANKAGSTMDWASG